MKRKFKPPRRGFGFKVGDRVIVTTTRWDVGHHKQSGLVCTITDINPHERTMPYVTDIGKMYAEGDIAHWDALVEDTRSYLEAITGGIDACS